MSAERPLALLYDDGEYVAVYKPAGLLMHRSEIARGADSFLLQRLRDQLRRRVYLIHRLDRPTAGVVLFAYSAEAAARMCARFEARAVEKRYLAVVRGYAPESGCIDYPLREAPDQPEREALTQYRRLATVELPIPVGRYPVARYSLLEVRPRTGRMHQIRKHFHHICHPLIGDTTHGEGRHNRLFRDHLGSHRLLLAAVGLHSPAAADTPELRIDAQPDAELRALFQRLGWGV